MSEAPKNRIHAHIFGRRRVGDREEVNMDLYNRDGTPFVPGTTPGPQGPQGEPGPKGDPGPAGQLPDVGPLRVDYITAMGTGQDGGPMFLVTGNFPDPLDVRNYEASYVTLGGKSFGQGVMQVTRSLMVIKFDNSLFSPADNGNGRFVIKRNSGNPNFTVLETVNYNYYYTWTPQPAYFYTTNVHAAGTTISIPKSQHGLVNMGSTTRAICVQVQDNATGAVEAPQSVVVNSSGTVTITFAASVAANSKRVTLIGGGYGT